MTDNKIIERIKALLAKAASTDYEAEAEAFFAKAYELMEKHQLDAKDLDKSDPMGSQHSNQRKGAVDWDFRLMFAVARYFGCKAIQLSTADAEGYLSGHYMDLFGRESARITAIEMHRYLVTTVRRLGRERCAAMGVSADACARRIGVALEIRLDSLAPKPEKAKTEIAKANALVTIDQLNALVSERYPKLHTINGRKFTNAMAQEIAQGIGLNLQTTYAGAKQLR